MAGAAQIEYDELQMRVEKLLEDLANHIREGSSLTMTKSIENICG